MFVIFKNEEGTYSVRPAFIGFIKNDIIRRTLCTLFFPLVLVFTIAINLLQAGVVSLYLLTRAVLHPLLKMRPIWKSEIWVRPRTKADSKRLLD